MGKQSQLLLQSIKVEFELGFQVGVKFDKSYPQSAYQLGLELSLEIKNSKYMCLSLDIYIVHKYNGFVLLTKYPGPTHHL